MIEVEGLSKRYGPTLAVNDLSFVVRPGTVTGFLGPNGAGKSTTMRMILGLDNPSGGRALVAGKPYASMHRPMHRVGALLDAHAIHPGRSAHAHLTSIALANGIGRARVTETLGIVGLDKVAGRRIGGFSLGMKQRLGIAAALLGDPQVLLFDEPVNGLDPEGIHWIRTLMKKLAAEGRTVFVSSHLMSEMALTAEHLIVIGKGRLIADTSTEDLISSASGGFLRVRSPHADQVARLLIDQGATDVTFDGDGRTLRVTGLDIETVAELAFASGLILHELSPQKSSLEDAYMEVTGDSVEYRADEREDDR